MDINNLKAEIEVDPIGRVYSGMTDIQVAQSLNNVLDRVVNKTTLTGSEVLNAIDKAEYTSKTSEEKQQVWDIVHLGSVNPFGIEADLMIDIFGSGSITITSLQSLRKNTISRANELGLGLIKQGYVEQARRVD